MDSASILGILEHLVELYFEGLGHRGFEFFNDLFIGEDALRDRLRHYLLQLHIELDVLGVLPGLCETESPLFNVQLPPLLLLWLLLFGVPRAKCIRVGLVNLLFCILEVILKLAPDATRHPVRDRHRH